MHPGKVGGGVQTCPGSCSGRRDPDQLGQAARGFQGGPAGPGPCTEAPGSPAPWKAGPTPDSWRPGSCPAPSWEPHLAELLVPALCGLEMMDGEEAVRLPGRLRAWLLRAAPVLSHVFPGGVQGLRGGGLSGTCPGAHREPRTSAGHAVSDAGMARPTQPRPGSHGAGSQPRVTCDKSLTLDLGGRGTAE